MKHNQKNGPQPGSDVCAFDEEAMAAYLAARLPESHAEALLLLRQAFPDLPLARRITATPHFHLRPRKP